MPDEICELLSIKDDLSRSTKSIGNVLKKYNEVIERELQPAKVGTYLLSFINNLGISYMKLSHISLDSFDEKILARNGDGHSTRSRPVYMEMHCIGKLCTKDFY